MGIYRPDLETPLYDMIYTLLSEVKFYVQKVEDVIVSTQLIESKLDDVNAKLTSIEVATEATEANTDALATQPLPVSDVDANNNLGILIADLVDVKAVLESASVDNGNSNEVRVKVIP